MAKIFWGSMMGRLVMALVSVAVVPVLIVGYFSFQAARNALEKAESDKLYSERELRRNELRKYFRDTMQNMQFMADTPSVRTAAVTLTSYHEVRRSSEDASFDVVSPLYSKIYDKIHSFFSSFLKTHESSMSGYNDILILDASEGNVMYSERKLGDLGANVKKGAIKDTGLAKVWQRVLETRQPATVDFTIYPVTGFPALFMGLPIAGEEGKLGGVMVLRLGPEYIHAVLKATEAQGRTVEAYLVGQDYKMRSDSRFAKEFTILNKEVKTKATTEALQKKIGTDLIENYRGVTVLCSYGTLGLNGIEGLGADFDWAIIAETDATDAFQPVSTLGNTVVLIALCLTLAALAVAVFLARAMAKPVIALAAKASEVSKGDLTVHVPSQGRKDEIGTLSRAFQEMLDSFREQTRQTMEGIAVLSASATKIAATVAQLGLSTTRTSEAISETTATVEQVKTSASVANEKAKNVAEASLQAVSTSEDGKRATEETVTRIHLIRENMSSIGETVVKLSEHSKAIEEIVAAVQDLADQSNLLAVNASIEAARAGDRGKGFAVVAHEIKSLADQSKEATDQIRTILGDTQRWVGAVVMATEQGSKAVEAGVEQSILAGEAIQSLATSVQTSSQAASVIGVSSQQQFTGVEQVASAMASIETAMRQNIEGTKQLEDEARRLEELGGSLKSSIERYKY